MITGTLERARNCLPTSVPDIPGSIKSSSTMSAPAGSNSASAAGPSVITVASKPSLRSRNASGSASDSSSSTISTLVIRAVPPHRFALHRHGLGSSMYFFLSLGHLGPDFALGQLVELFALGVIRGDGQGERRPCSQLAPQPDRAVVIGRDVLDDGKAQPGAAGGPRARLVGAEKPLEYPLLVFAGDPDAPVGDGDLDVGAAATAADGSQRAGW